MSVTQLPEQGGLGAQAIVLPNPLRDSDIVTKKNVTSRAWCFTWNNYTTEQPDFSLLNGCDFACWQVEKAPTTGQLHLQGYCHFKSPVRMSVLKKLLNGAHFEQARGTAEDNERYCTKEESRVAGPFFYGKTPHKQGHRSDIVEFVSHIKRGATDAELIDLCPSAYVKYHKAGDKIRSVLHKWEPKPLIVELYYGPTNTGKTYKAITENAGYYFKPPGPWWDGYESNKVVIMDEFDGRFFTFGDCKIYLDSVLGTLPVKGSYVPRAYEKVILISNLHPKEWYRDHFRYYPQSILELKKRINKVYVFKGIGDFSEADETFWN